MSTEVATGGSHSSSGLPIGGVTSQEKAAALSPVVRPRKGLFSQEKDGGLQASAVPAKLTRPHSTLTFPQNHTPAAGSGQSELSSCRAACGEHSVELAPPQLARQ